MDQLNLKFDHDPKINSFDIQCIKKVFRIQRRPEFFYRSKIKGSPGQYILAFADWIIKQVRNDSDFFLKTRRKAKGKVL